MLRMRDIMTEELATLSPEHTLREAMSLFSSHHISGAPVLANGKVVGVVSLTDIADFVSTSPGVPTERPELAEWGEWDEDRDQPEGEEPPSAFFSQLWDDAGAEVSERIEQTRGPEWNTFEEHVVDEVMTRDVRSLAPETSVEFGAEFMRQHRIHRVLVMDEEDLVGLVSATDIANAVADRGLLKS